MFVLNHPFVLNLEGIVLRQVQKKQTLGKLVRVNWREQSILPNRLRAQACNEDHGPQSHIPENKSGNSKKKQYRDREKVPSTRFKITIL